MLSNVDSWPPCKEDVDVKTAAGLSIKAPDSHKSDVVSKKDFRAAAMSAKRVGEPSARPLQSSNSLFEIMGTSWAT